MKIKKNKVYILILVGVFLLVFVTTSFVYSIYNTSKNTFDNINIEENKNNINNLKKNELKPISFLLLGIGDRPNDPGRSDSIIVVSVNPIDKSILMFNVPRDSRLPIIGKNKIDKINHAYAYGGYEMTKDSIENFLDTPIDYVIEVNMNGFREIIDSLDGIQVYNKFSFSQEDELGKKIYHFKEGKIFLTGDEAMAYVRMRKSDPKGDLGRNERQRQVLNEVFNRIASFSSFSKIQDLLYILGENVKTNLSFDDMKIIFRDYLKISYDINIYEIKGENLMIDGKYYYDIPENEILNISNLFKKYNSKDN